MLKNLEEKVKKLLEDEPEVKSISKGDYITVFKKLGVYKSSTKTINLKPDYIAERLRGGIDYIFICSSVFDCFNIMSKFALFNLLKLPLDCRRLIFYFEDDEPLYNVEEFGLLNSQNKYKVSNCFNQVLELTNWFSEKIKKEIVIKRVE